MTGYVGPIEKDTLDNNFSARYCSPANTTQLVVMCLQGGEEIGNEVHSDVDQSSVLKKAMPGSQGGAYCG